ncbi:MAG: anaerobic ribonucleoside-triphosphate reductase [Treponema sp.]|nr:anaerobic ribonucleoside-triphosphate reductase [Treponema sp.]
MLKENQEKLNAADRKSYVGEIYNIGKRAFEYEELDYPNNYPNGYMYVHDKDAYGRTYNCLGFDIKNAFPYKDFEGLDKTLIIVGTFDFMKELFAKMGNEQSGGMALVNFDIDFAHIFTKLGVDFKGNEPLFKACIRTMILWCNNMHTRMGQTSYYVSFNIGLGTDEFSRFLTYTLIDEFENAGDLVFKPNIIFKVHQGVNRSKTDPNFDLYQKSLNCSAKKMIPTYLLCDCEEDKNTDPLLLSVMGCRTRVVDDIHGCKGSVGRGNIANVSINLPLIALRSIFENDKPQTVEQKYEATKKLWLEIAGQTAQTLVDRWKKTLNAKPELFPTNHEYKLWCEDMNKVGVKETLKHGTLAIGFIGLSETIQLITGKKFWEDDQSYKLALDFVAFMRSYTDSLTKKYGINFSLLATAGENISGAFTEYFDMYLNRYEINADENYAFLRKGFLTNSFHVDVDSGVSAIKKLQLEGPFHKYSNGGSISYVELGEAPLGNAEGLAELTEVAIQSGVRYLGFNFPKDVCRDCGTSGLFDKCPVCGGKNIARIRRVSGYLEILDGFTKGKTAEVAHRKENK